MLKEDEVYYIQSRLSGKVVDVCGRTEARTKIHLRSLNKSNYKK